MSIRWFNCERENDSFNQISTDKMCTKRKKSCLYQ